MEAPLIGIVDHDLASSRLADKALTAEGYRTLVLLEGSDPFYTIRQERPDVIVVNPALDAPELDWGLLHLLRRDARTKDTPVLVCSDDTAGFLKKADDLAGLAKLSIVRKPFSPDELITAVRDLLA